LEFILSPEINHNVILAIPDFVGESPESLSIATFQIPDKPE
jgi:hypothetical protein